MFIKILQHSQILKLIQENTQKIKERNRIYYAKREYILIFLYCYLNYLNYSYSAFTEHVTTDSETLPPKNLTNFIEQMSNYLNIPIHQIAF